MESSLYDEVWILRRDGLISLCYLGLGGAEVLRGGFPRGQTAPALGTSGVGSCP